MSTPENAHKNEIASRSGVSGADSVQDPPLQRTHRIKDGWDKFSAVSTFLSGVVIAAVLAGGGLVLEHRHNQRRLELRRIEILASFLPHLADEGLREAALLAINALGPDELAMELALQYGGQGAESALSQIAERAAVLADNGELARQAIEVREQLLKIEPELSRIRVKEPDGDVREVPTKEALADKIPAGEPIPSLSEILKRGDGKFLQEFNGPKMESELRAMRALRHLGGERP